MSVAIEPCCPALVEAAAIVEAEWIRVRCSSEKGAHVTGGLPARRPGPRRASTVVTVGPTPYAGSVEQARPDARWQVSMVWPRQRSPPLHS
ncbi:hypothetical protein [Mycobacterium ahvazicum]|uniref:hypothetical protein n=1 Tax=Mycobacterium ahvazicum TaxID=1964395 RepID=UPI0010570B80|nr:hypothetical protein [Mycobacterium ahvazicum]